MSAQVARAFWLTGPGESEIRTESLPAPGPEDVCVRTLYTGISRGSECLVHQGNVPASQRAVMRAPFQGGEFPGPVKYGYSSVGRVDAGPESLRGRTVFCLFPHQTAYVVPARSVVPLPAGVPPGRAVLAANLETAVNGLWDAAVGVGDRVAVVGAGAVGCLVAYLARRIPGCQVQLVDSRAARESVARALGVGFALPGDATGDADVVVHASGDPAGLTTALGLAGFEAVVLELSWFGDRTVTLPLGEAFHSRRLSLRSSQVGRVSPERRARWSPRRRLAAALGLLADPELEVLVTGESSFAELPDTMRRLCTQGADAICHRVRYDEEG